MQLEFSSIIEESKPTQTPKIEQLMLEIEETTSYYTFTSNLNSVLTWKPSNLITFSNGTTQCGTFSWENGIFKFSGEAETSAKLFANYVAKYCGLKVQA